MLSKNCLKHISLLKVVFHCPPREIASNVYFSISKWIHIEFIFCFLYISKQVWYFQCTVFSLKTFTSEGCQTTLQTTWIRKGQTKVDYRLQSCLEGLVMKARLLFFHSSKLTDLYFENISYALQGTTLCDARCIYL